MRSRIAGLLLLLLVATGVNAGQTCQSIEVSPEAISAATALAREASAQLNSQSAPVALIARQGTSLEQYDLHYSHLGFVWRETPAHPWRVVHLLNTCGTAKSNLFKEGLANFFVDANAGEDFLIVWLKPEWTRRLHQRLTGDGFRGLHDPDYNVIANPYSRTYQNSTMWILESVIAASETILRDRAAIARVLQNHHFQPDHLKIAYSKRIVGGLFAANADFTDHRVATRLKGQYPVVTVRSIIRYLEQQQGIADLFEKRAGKIASRSRFDRL